MWSTTNVDYLTGWASGLRDKKGLNITALAVAYVSVMLLVLCMLFVVVLLADETALPSE